MPEVEERYKTVLRELTALSVTQQALISALIETHPHPLALLVASRRHIEAQAATALAMAIDERQLDRILTGGEQMLAKMDKAFAHVTNG